MMHGPTNVKFLYSDGLKVSNRAFLTWSLVLSSLLALFEKDIF